MGNEAVKEIKQVIDNISERRCIQFLWWLKDNSLALDAFKREKVDAMKVYNKFNENKKWK